MAYGHAVFGKASGLRWYLNDGGAARGLLYRSRDGDNNNGSPGWTLIEAIMRYDKDRAASGLFGAGSGNKIGPVNFSPSHLRRFLVFIWRCCCFSQESMASRASVVAGTCARSATAPSRL